MFTADLEDKRAAIGFYTEATRAAEEDRHEKTRVLFEQVLLDEEGQKDWLSQQLQLLGRMGEPTYMSQDMSGRAKGP